MSRKVSRDEQFFKFPERGCPFSFPSPMAVCTAGNIKVLFDHFIEGEELSTILKESFKHFIFLRRQLPLPYLLLEREQKTHQNGLGNNNGRYHQSDGKKVGPRVLGLRGTKARKRDAAIANIKCYLNDLDCFGCIGGIFAIALVFGSTIISPKEIFLMRPKFRKPDEDLHLEDTIKINVPLAKRIDKSARSMMRHLVTNPELSSLCEMRPTNVFLFVLAKRSPESLISDGFLPKQGYQLPQKGKHYNIILTNEDAFDTIETNLLSELSNLQVERDLIWYQAKGVLKGFSESKSTIY